MYSKPRKSYIHDKLEIDINKKKYLKHKKSFTRIQVQKRIPKLDRTTNIEV